MADSTNDGQGTVDGRAENWENKVGACLASTAIVGEDLRGWSPMCASAGTAPSARGYSTGVAYMNNLWVFGGSAGSSRKNDLHRCSSAKPTLMDCLMLSILLFATHFVLPHYHRSAGSSSPHGRGMFLNAQAKSPLLATPIGNATTDLGFHREEMIN